MADEPTTLSKSHAAMAAEISRLREALQETVQTGEFILEDPRYRGYPGMLSRVQRMVDLAKRLLVVLIVPWALL